MSDSDFKRNHGSGAPSEPSACLFHNPHAKESASTSLDHHPELVSVRALHFSYLSKALITPTSHPLSNLSAMCLPCCTHTHKRNSENANISSHEHISMSRAHSHTPTHQHTNTCTRHLQSLEDNVLRHILQHHSWVCLIISDSIEHNHLIFFTCSKLLLQLYWDRIWQRGYTDADPLWRQRRSRRELKVSKCVSCSVQGCKENGVCSIVFEIFSIFDGSRR